MQGKARYLVPLGVLALALWGTAAAEAAPIFFVPNTPYLSQADIPAGFYAGGSPTALEDFEDGTLDFGITASAGGVQFPGLQTDSVDGDDGSIDGLGNGGHSWYTNDGSAGVTFSFSSPVTAAGLVWTDGYPGLTTLTVELIGETGVIFTGDLQFDGTTGEDRFLGVQDVNGFTGIRITHGGAVDIGLEVDHVQYGNMPGQNPVPEPSSLALLGIGALGLVGYNRRRKQRGSV